MAHSLIYSLEYTDKVPEGFAGYAKAWFIRIKPEYKEDIGLLEHEKIHVRQFWRTLGFHGLFYLISKTYRLNSEVEAYRKQASFYSEDRLPLFASFIATKYNIGISEELALQLLRG